MGINKIEAMICSGYRMEIVRHSLLTRPVNQEIRKRDRNRLILDTMNNKERRFASLKMVGRYNGIK